MSAKGPNWEREMCKRLSLWWTEGESDHVFWRTSQSGGRATVRSRKGQKTSNSHGDMCALDPIGQPFLDVFSTEFKAGYNRDTLHALLDATPRSAQQTFHKWVEQAEFSRKNAGALHWLLITRRDRREILVTMDFQADLALMIRGCPLRSRDHLNMRCKGMELRTYLFKDFLEDVTPTMVRDWSTFTDKAWRESLLDKIKGACRDA